MSDEIVSTLWPIIKSKSFAIPVCSNLVLLFCSDCFPKNYTEKEAPDAIASTLKRAPDRKDRGGCKQEVMVEDLNQSDNGDEEEEFEEEEEMLGRESGSSSSSNVYYLIGHLCMSIFYLNIIFMVHHIF